MPLRKNLLFCGHGDTSQVHIHVCVWVCVRAEAGAKAGRGVGVVFILVQMFLQEKNLHTAV